MTVTNSLVRPLAVVLAFALCGAPEALAQAAQQQPSPATAPATGSSQDTSQQQSAWPTQEAAPQNPAAPAPAPNTAPATAPTQDQPQPNQAQPNPRVVLGPNGQTQAPAAQPNRGTSVDPSAAPLAPAPNAQPAVPTETPENQSQPPQAPQPQTTMTQKPTPQPPSPEPLGTAAAEGVRTAGSGASKPAGAAIAPAKQHRMRSLLIKLGAVAAAGVAVGTVAALSRKTPSVPPNTTTAAATK